MTSFEKITKEKYLAAALIPLAAVALNSCAPSESENPQPAPGVESPNPETTDASPQPETQETTSSEPEVTISDPRETELPGDIDTTEPTEKASETVESLELSAELSSPEELGRAYVDLINGWISAGTRDDEAVERLLDETWRKSGITFGEKLDFFKKEADKHAEVYAEALYGEDWHNSPLFNRAVEHYTLVNQLYMSSLVFTEHVGYDFSQSFEIIDIEVIDEQPNSLTLRVKGRDIVEIDQELDTHRIGDIDGVISSNDIKFDRDGDTWKVVDITNLVKH